jgi:hypothetical protein
MNNQQMHINRYVFGKITDDMSSGPLSMWRQFDDKLLTFFANEIFETAPDFCFGAFDVDRVTYSVRCFKHSPNQRQFILDALDNGTPFRLLRDVQKTGG